MDAATVTQTSPLQVRLDTGTEPVAARVLTFGGPAWAPQLGARVAVDQIGPKTYIVGGL